MNLQISRSAAAKELLTRRSIRRSLTEWCRYCGFEPAKHHELVIEKLEAVARGDIPRLAIFMPPGSAKSTYASVLFPPWLMANLEGANVLAASHTTELAEKWGRRVRNLISEHSLVLGVELSADSQAAGRWSLAGGSEYYAAGVGTGIAGFRAKLGVIDDPIRSRQDADSELIRDRTWDWYINDFRTRLVPGAREVLIQTRWHEDDLAGRALNHLHWETINLPAIAEENDPLGRSIGDPLWDDAYGYGQQLVELRKTTPARTWSALYQQRPAPEEGDFFRSDWLRPYELYPPRETMRVYGGSDYAVTADGGDYTVHVVVGLDPAGRMFLLDLWRKQASSEEWVEAFCDLVLRWKPLGWAEEQGQIRAGVGPYLDRVARERRAYVVRDAFPTRGDKAVRAQSIRGRMGSLGLYVPDRAPWYPAFRSELLSFPAGKHDDQVDAMGLVGQLIDRMVAGSSPPAPAHDAIAQMLKPKTLNQMIEEFEMARAND
jgi:predicted phage terminase large subunit-like protein